MVDRNVSNIARRSDRVGKALASNSYNFVTEEPLSRNSLIKEPRLTEDLILSLANAYENKRARQVSEWERRQNSRRALL